MITVTGIQKKLFYILGLFCTFIALKFGGGVALSNYIILLIIVVQLVSKRKLYFYWYKLPLYLFIMLMPASVILNFANINKTVISDGLGITIKFIAFILPIIILFNDKELCLYRKSFFKGLYLGSCIQLIWGIMQIMLYHFNGIYLNELVFGDLLHIDLGSASWICLSGIGIRPTGIGWEPAVYAISLLFGFAYTDKFYFKLLFAVGILSSTSSTGIIALAALTVYEITINMYIARKNKPRRTLRNRNNSVFRILSIFTVIIFIMLLTIVYSKYLTSNLISYANASMQRVAKIILGQNGEEKSTSIHLLYYQKLIPTLFSGSILNSVFGYGNFMVGRLYSSLYGLYSSSSNAWNPESDFVTILLGTGIIGSILYYFINFKAFILCNERKLKKYLVIIIVCGFTYLFIRGTFTFLIIIFLMCKENNTNIIDESRKKL